MQHQVRGLPPRIREPAAGTVALGTLLYLLQPPPPTPDAAIPNTLGGLSRPFRTPPSDGYNPHDNHMPTGTNMSRHPPQPWQFSILNQAKPCPTIGVHLISRVSYYRSLRPAAPRPKRRRKIRRRLSETKRAEMCAILNSDRFLDLPPHQIWATLLNEGTGPLAHHVPHPLRIQGDTPAQKSARTSSLHEAGAVGLRSEPDVDVGYHHTSGPQEGHVLQAVRGPGCLQPLRGGMDYSPL